ncbi:MAG TPA: hypothetical protein VLM75_02535 [Spirochaetota bacterium]|nr:hypothetical protein [Spirochaetota bacterium]
MKSRLYPFLAFILLAFCATLGDSTLRELPVDREYPIVIRHVIDPRLPALSEAEFQDMLGRCKNYIDEYLGYRVSFFIQGNQSMQAFREEVKRLDDLPMMHQLKNSLLDIDSEGDRGRLAKYIDELVSSAPETTLQQHVPGFKRYKDRKEISSHIYRQYVEKLRKIQNIKTSDGTRLAESPHDSTLTYPFWDMALRHLEGAHFIFTNTIMADMEVDIPIYVALRYGITTGLVEENIHNAYRASGVIFTYPFLSRDGFFVAERGEETPAELVTDVIALYATHEFGHFLNHYRDYYDHHNCIMVPAHDLDYYRWYKDKKEKKCALEHEKLKRF